MAPPQEPWSAHELPERVQGLPSGRRRKGDAIDLAQCQLLKWTQYECDVRPRGEIECWPLERLFRRCAKGLMVETTALEPLGNLEEKTQRRREIAEKGAGGRDAERELGKGR